MDTGTVYLVEDNEEVGRMYERAFRLRGHKVERATDGRKALQQLISSLVVPAVIILDVAMPSMNGFDVLVAIRAISKLASVPIAILTNSIHTEEEGRFLKAGASLFLVKIENQSKQVVEKIEALMLKTGTTGT